jgi:hypothetical protein
MDSIEHERAQITERAQALVAQGICPSCHDLETGEPYGRGDRVIYEDDRFLVVLERFPRVAGHTIVTTYKPHREDISALTDEESAEVMSMSVRVTRALKGRARCREGVPEHDVRRAESLASPTVPALCG